MRAADADRALRVLLILVGGVELLAVPFILVPVGWMGVIHERVLGLGPMPAGPLVEYMARSLSALYAVHGAAVFFVSFDVPRYRPLILLLGSVHLFLGLCLLMTDVVVGWPWWWTLGEGPSIISAAVLTLVLARAGGRDSASKT